MPTAPPPPRPPLIDRLLDRRDAWRRRILRHRGALAALIAALTVYVVVHTLTTPPPPTQGVWVARRDLPSGATLTAGDLVRRQFARGTPPSRIVTDPGRVAGAVLALPVAAGMPLPRDALMGARWLDGYPGLSAVPVRITDPAIAPLLGVGERVDLVATDPGETSSGRADVHRVTVLSLPPATADAGPLGGRLVLVGVRPDEVGELSAESARSVVTVVWPADLGGS